MTATVIPELETTALPDAETRQELRTGLPAVTLWLSSLLVFFAPRRIGDRWRGATLPEASLIAIVNFFTLPLWMGVVLVCSKIWERSPLTPAGELWSWSYVVRLAGELYLSWTKSLHALNSLDRLSAGLGLLMLLCAGLVIPFFVLLPFGARPGPNRPCIRHVARTVLLGTGAIHFWAIGIAAVFLMLARGARVNDSIRMLSYVLLVLTTMAGWQLAALIAAVRRDYRTADDFPKPHEPWCDNCGYNLVAAPEDGRCPECGRLVSDSLGAHMRHPTPWEKRPSVLNIRVVGDQLAQLVRQPRQLFFSMPTLNGQPAAQRWLIMSMICVFLLASCIVPALSRALGGNEYFDIFAGAVAMGFAWMIFAAMMVGIETAGIATFSRMRSQQYGIGRGVYLAAAAKVTAYSSILMIVWVVLGGIQLVWSVSWLNHVMVPAAVHSLRNQQIILAGSLAVAHIGGLLWYELTVYRGIRAIQYANK